jgi:hypothetical protein
MRLLMQLWQLLSQMHEDIDNQLDPRTWLAALLPPLVVHHSDLIAASTPSLGGFERSDVSQDTPANPQLFSPEPASIGSPCTGAGFSGQGETPGILGPQQHQPTQCSFPEEFYPIGLDRASADSVAKLVLEVCCPLQSFMHRVNPNSDCSSKALAQYSLEHVPAVFCTGNGRVLASGFDILPRYSMPVLSNLLRRAG